MENNYAIQFPEIMKGKKILYVHGFSSSGQSGTVVKIREMLPGATVVAPRPPTCRCILPRPWTCFTILARLKIPT